MRYTIAAPLTWTQWLFSFFGSAVPQYIIVDESMVDETPKGDEVRPKGATLKQPLMPTGAPAAGAHL